MIYELSSNKAPIKTNNNMEVNYKICSVRGLGSILGTHMEEGESFPQVVP